MPMSLLSDLIRPALATLLRLVLSLAVAVFALSVLLVAAVFVLFGLLWSILTGRKPALQVLWQRYRRAAPQPRWSRSPTMHRAARPTGATAEIEDVQAREITPRSP